MRQQTFVSLPRAASLGALVAVVGWAGVVATASANTYPANSEATFATAVADANSNPGANTIDVATGTYSPTQTLVFTNTTGPLTIQGPVPSATVSTNAAHFTGGALVTPMPGASVFSVSPGVTVNFDAIDITTAGSAGNGVIDDSGIANLNQSTVTGQGPGLTVESGATATLLDSTISDGLDFGIIDDGTLTLTNSTVTRNPNGGIDNANGTLNLINSIVAKNGSPDCTGPVTSSDHSMDGDGTCVLGANSQSDKNPLLEAINTHGGSTPTDIPEAGSPALDAGDPAKCPTIDQRGAASPSVAGDACDMGSVETYYGVKPVLTNADITVGSTSASGTVATYTPTWTAGSPVTSVTCSPASGTSFPVGTTTVTCDGTDSVFGATGTGTFTVTDIQATAPVITVPSDITVAATSTSGAIVPYPAAAATDSDGTDPPVTCTAPVGTSPPGSTVTVPPAGVEFPVGTTTLTCSATDASSGLSSTATFTITVTAYVPPPVPVIEVPPDMTVNATSSAGAVVSYPPATAADPAGGSDTVTCTPATGSTFAVGSTTVTCNTTDRAGVSAAPATFTITVEGGNVPVITVPADMSVPATMPGGAQVTYAATATDAKDGTDPVTCTPASGATFPITTTTVNCSATDSLGNTSTATFTVTVTESTPPTINVPANITAAATGAGGAAVNFTVTATDPVDGVLSPTCTPASGSTFPVGTTTVTCTATDKASIPASASFTITVPVPGAPVITVPPFRELGAINSAGDPVTYVVTATDQIDKTDPVTCSPASGSTFPIGLTNVTCTATDSGGRTSTATFQVQVDPPETTSSGPSNVFSLVRTSLKADESVLSLKLPGPGRLAVLETFDEKVKGKTKTVTFARVADIVKKGARQLTLKPGKAGVAELSKLVESKKLSVKLTITFTPTDGTAHSEHETLKIKGLEP